MKVNLVTETVIDAWRHILATGQAGQKLLPDNPLHLYFGADIASRPVFFLVTELSSHAPKFAELVQVEHGRRPDGKWTVVLTLNDHHFLETFMGMCLELARRTAEGADESAGLVIFDRTIKQWRRLLTYKGARRLTEKEIRGLAAELWFLLELSKSIVSPSIAVDAWTGPLGAPHDFRLSRTSVFELKAVRSGATAVQVSSLEQLEAEPGDRLELVLVTVNDSPDPTSRSALSLIQLVEEIRSRLKHDEDALEAFETKLALLQFDPTDDYYATRAFDIIRSRHFSVHDDFPRIPKSSVPLGAIRVKYQIQIDAIMTFLLSEGLDAHAGRFKKEGDT